MDKPRTAPPTSNYSLIPHGQVAKLQNICSSLYAHGGEDTRTMAKQAEGILRSIEGPLTGDVGIVKNIAELRLVITDNGIESMCEEVFELITYLQDLLERKSELYDSTVLVAEDTYQWVIQDVLKIDISTLGNIFKS